MNKIAGYRKMLGMTQQDMAKRMQISRQTYSLKENGKISFSDDEKIILKELLIQIFPNITIDEIFFRNKVSQS